jgi:hypothetical protein
MRRDVLYGSCRKGSQAVDRLLTACPAATIAYLRLERPAAAYEVACEVSLQFEQSRRKAHGDYGH